MQVFYNGGVSRWYMAFNETVHDNAYSYNDDFRILWAWSDDGRSWTVYNSFILRKPAVCVGGLLVTDLFIDEFSKFYLVFTDVYTNKVYLARASFAGTGPSIPGYTSNWEILGNKIPPVTDQYIWRTIPNSYLTSGTPVNMGPGTCTSSPPSSCSLDAVSIIPADQYNTATGFFVKQAALTRVFASSAAGSASRYVVLTADRPGGGAGGSCDGGNQFGRVYSSDSLDKPFQYEHQDLASGSGCNGFEPGFTHYPDNLPGSPRVFAQGLDLWLVGNGCPGSNGFCSTTLARSTYALTGGIFSLPPAPTSVTTSSGPATGGNVVTIYGSNFHSGPPATTVRFGGISATGVTVVSATQITAIAPAHAVGAVAIDVTNGDYPTGLTGFTSLTGSLANAYTYIALSGLSLNPPSVGGGNPSTGTVTLTSYATGGAVVSLWSSNPPVASVPSSVSGYFSTTTFSVTTQPVAVDTVVTIYASYGGVTLQAPLTVRKVAWGGWHDVSRCDMSWGWAWDANRPNTPVQVSIYSEVGWLNTIWADSYRQDLAQAGIGNGVHAYWYTHPPQIQDGATHTISIYAGNPWDGLGLTLLGGSPKSFACSVSAHVIWIQPQYTAGFGPPGSLIVAGSASGAPAGTGVTMYWRDATAGSGWTTWSPPYAPVPDGNGTWYNSIPNVNFSHVYNVYVVYGAITSPTCTYAGNGGYNSCP